jgi:L-ribulokinase
MPIVAGVDFGTLSVRVSIVDSARGRLGAAAASYPLHRSPADPDHATQSHADQLTALVHAAADALRDAAVPGDTVEAIALDTTGSSVIPVGDNLTPLDDYYLWCDHRAWREAALITNTAHSLNLPVIQWSGGAYSSEWGFSKLLHWLRANPSRRGQLVTALENCDMIAAVLCGISHPDQLPRSICAMGHKWMWNHSLGGLPPADFLTAVDPLLNDIRPKMARGRYLTSDKIAGRLCSEWAAKLGLRPGIPIPVGALDAHWDAIGAGCRLGDVVNVIGTSTCIMAITPSATLIPGLCGVVPGSIHPSQTGLEAGLSATGDIFEAIARRANTSVSALSAGLDRYRAGQTGLLRIAWDNGDRTVLVNPELGGITLGWNLSHTAQDELFAAIEGTAFHTRVILERMVEHGVPVSRIINGGGIPQRSDVLNRVYANVLNKPVLVPTAEPTSLGAAIFAFLAAGTFRSVEQAQDALCPSYRVVEPDPVAAQTYDSLYPFFKKIYYNFGKSPATPDSFCDLLPHLRALASTARNQS